MTKKCGHTILAVDDNPTNILLFEELLGDDYELLTAKDGAEALVSTFEHQPDILLLDIMMPGMDGYEVTRRLRAAKLANEPKIILVSAKNTTTDRIEGYEAGADDYLIKPFDEDELVAKLSVYLELKSVQQIDQFKTDVISLFNYETRTPLSGITGPLEILKNNNDSSTPEERMRWLEAMETSADNLSRFILKALQLSELKSGQYTIGMESVDGREMIESAISELKDMSENAGINIESTLSDKIEFSGDRELLHQGMVEIVRNAIQHSEEDSTVTIEATREGGQASIKVKNFGKTIDWKILPHLFDGMLIVEDDSGTTRKTLSLAIVKEITDLHDGSLSANSSQESGTEFHLQLPLAS